MTWPILFHFRVLIFISIAELGERRRNGVEFQVFAAETSYIPARTVTRESVQPNIDNARRIEMDSGGSPRTRE
jgi:hypothetical protein